MLVVAGAGSGKTRVLTYRIAHLIRDLGVSPYGLLAITFTNKAADEMKQRVAALVGGVARGMWVSTFHSACVRILRRDAPMLGYRSNFSIYDDLDSRRAGGVLRARPGPRPQALSPQGPPRRHREGQERTDRLRVVRLHGQRPLPRAGGRRLPPVPAAPARGLGHGLRRPAHGDRRTAGGLPPGAGALPGPLPLPAGGRVPGHQPRPVPPGADAGGPAPQRVRGGRLRPEHLRLPRRRHPQHPGVPAGLPRRPGGRARPQLPLHPDHPRRRQRGHRAQPGTPAQAPVDRPGGGRPDHRVPGAGRARRGRLHRRGGGGPGRRRHPSRRGLPSSTGPMPSPGCSRRSWSATGCPTR